ncbi:isochorismate synthase [Vibrio sp. WXL210]|uniref:isochorismate synthase n=1 Tax=Vibrio sp. WXL210 TaxID=3450709 RepID=UPI003EC70F33
MNFAATITSLIEQISTAPAEQVRFTQPLGDQFVVERHQLVDWLDAQPLYPKFFWQDREGDESVAALGQMYTFHQPAPAYTILAQHQRVWGGRAFSSMSKGGPRCLSSLFFLPIVELTLKAGQWCLVVNTNRSRGDAISALNRLTFEITPKPSSAPKVCRASHNPEQAQWDQLVEQALGEIEQNKFKKVVLARKSTLEMAQKVSAAAVMKASIANNHDSFHFLFAMDAGHSFIGSTPERLYRRDDRVLLTEALAGTIGRGVNHEQDQQLAQWLAQDGKNLQENQYVVDDIVERLTPLSERIEVEENAELIRLRRVQHLKRAIYAQLKDEVRGDKLLDALQPTAAVAGLPREPSMQFIDHNEPFLRGWYAGSVGYLSHERAEFCVAIRSALVMDRTVYLFAGAGIVAGSKAEYEWQELDKKLATLLTLLVEEKTEISGVCP